METETVINAAKQRYESEKFKDRKVSKQMSIYQVPLSFKRNKPEAYAAQVVYLGPYQNNQEGKLGPMDDYKFQALQSVLERLRVTNLLPDIVNLDWLLEQVTVIKEEIRRCYEDYVADWNDEKLVFMMTVDACFVTEFLRMELCQMESIHLNHVFNFPRSGCIKQREALMDIMKLENQLPMRLLQKILDLEFHGESHVNQFLAQHLSKFSYFKAYPFCYSDVGNISLIKSHLDRGVQHLLDLSRMLITDFLLKSSTGGYHTVAARPSAQAQTGSNVPDAVLQGEENQTGSNVPVSERPTGSNVPVAVSPEVAHHLLPSAEKLRNAGILLKKAVDEHRVHFKRIGICQWSTLFVPEIHIDEYTDTFLRNIMAFEQCHRRDVPNMCFHEHFTIQQVICEHMWIMSQLIVSKEDVKILRRAGIIKNHLGPDDKVAKMFSDVCLGASVDLNTNVKENFKMAFNQYRCMALSKFTFNILYTILDTILQIKSKFCGLVSRS